MAEEPGSTTHTLAKASSASMHNLYGAGGAGGSGGGSGSGGNSPNGTLSKRFVSGGLYVCIMCIVQCTCKCTTH